MIVGVRKMTISVFVDSSSWFRKAAPITGISPKRHFAGGFDLSSLISPADDDRHPVFDHDGRLGFGGLHNGDRCYLLLVVKLPVTELTSGLIFMVTKPSLWMVGGRTA